MGTNSTHFLAKRNCAGIVLLEKQSLPRRIVLSRLHTTRPAVHLRSDEYSGMRIDNKLHWRGADAFTRPWGCVRQVQPSLDIICLEYGRAHGDETPPARSDQLLAACTILCRPLEQLLAWLLSSFLPNEIMC